jgi:hypothetical protein
MSAAVVFPGITTLSVVPRARAALIALGPMSVRSALRRYIKHIAIQYGLELAALCAGRLFAGAAERGLVFTLHHVRPPRGLAFEPNDLL